jgi:hypothetical protein
LIKKQINQAKKHYYDHYSIFTASRLFFHSSYLLFNKVCRREIEPLSEKVYQYRCEQHPHSRNAHGDHYLQAFACQSGEHHAVDVGNIRVCHVPDAVPEGVDFKINLQAVPGPAALPL